MSKLKYLQEFTSKHISELTTEELFELKKLEDKWWEEALSRINNLEEPKE